MNDTEQAALPQLLERIEALEETLRDVAHGYDGLWESEYSGTSYTYPASLTRAEALLGSPVGEP